MSGYIDIAQIAAGVTALGYGKRAGAWMHGCTIGCNRCCSQHIWEGTGRRLKIADIIDWWLTQPAPDGLSLSGGEPSEQADAALELIGAFREAFGGATADVLMFSGLPYARLQAQFPELTAACDVVCAGPYVWNLPPLPLRGSSNQTLHLQTELAQLRYHDVDQWPVHATQVAFGKDRAVTVGIPNAVGLTQLLQVKTLDPRTASWTKESCND